MKNTPQAGIHQHISVVNPHKRCLFGLGTTKMENNYHIDPPARPSYSSISFREVD
uniref:Uncharacterized protein n=1 Tax=Brassica campestris TaxID=3711 RepID=A0A3P6BJG8_BRACM|nr:unnamed protein product [Brassica rapa]